MICPKCGKSNADNSSFCANCGATLNSVQGGPFDNGIVNTSVPSTNDVNNSVPFVQNTISNPQSISGGSFTSNPSLNQDSVSLPTSNPSPKKFNIMIPIGVGVVLLAVAAMVGLNVFSKPDETNTNNNSSGVSGVSEKQQSLDDNISVLDIPIPVKKDGKYGYIDSKGSFVIEPKYKSALDFKGNYALVREKGVRYDIIDKNGNIKLSGFRFNDIIYDFYDDVWILSNSLYSNSLNKLSSDDIKVDYSDDNMRYFSWKNDNNSTVGIIDKSGKITYTYKLQNGENDFHVFPSKVHYPIKDDYCLVNIDDMKYGIVNCDTGKMIYDYTDKYIENVGDNIFEIKENSSSIDSLSIIYIQNDKICLETSGSNASITYHEAGYVVLHDYNNSEILSHNIISNEQFNKQPSKFNEAITYWTEWQEFTKLIEFRNGNYVGLKTTEKEVIPAEWERFQYFDIKLQKLLSENGKNCILATKNYKQYLLDLNDGKIITEFNSSKNYLGPNHKSTFLFFEEDDTGEWIIYNIITGKNMKMSDNNLDCSAINYCVIEENNKRNYYNMDLELIYSEEL